MAPIRVVIANVWGRDTSYDTLPSFRKVTCAGFGPVSGKKAPRFEKRHSQNVQAVPAMFAVTRGGLGPPDGEAGICTTGRVEQASSPANTRAIALHGRAGPMKKL
jgi:hypothetical protein